MYGDPTYVGWLLYLALCIFRRPQLAHLGGGGILPRPHPLLQQGLAHRASGAPRSSRPLQVCLPFVGMLLRAGRRPRQRSPTWTRRPRELKPWLLSTSASLPRSRTSTSSASSSSSLSAPCQGPLEREALAQAIGEAKEAADVHVLPLSDSLFLNCPGGKWHRIPKTGMLGASSSWTAACGWRFAGSLASLARDLPPASVS